MHVSNHRKVSFKPLIFDGNVVPYNRLRTNIVSFFLSDLIRLQTSTTASLPHVWTTAHARIRSFTITVPVTWATPGPTVRLVSVTWRPARFGFSKWETTLQRNVVSHWLSTYPGWSQWTMKMLWHGNAFRVIGFLSGESTGHGLPAQKTSNAEFMFSLL